MWSNMYDIHMYDIDMHDIDIHIKLPLFLSDFNGTWIFSVGSRKNAQMPNFIYIRPVAAELFRAGRQTGRTDMTN